VELETVAVVSAPASGVTTMVLPSAVLTAPTRRTTAPEAGVADWIGIVPAAQAKLPEIPVAPSNNAEINNFGRSALMKTILIIYIAEGVELRDLQSFTRVKQNNGQTPQNGKNRCVLKRIRLSILLIDELQTPGYDYEGRLREFIGMRVLILRNFICWVMIVLLPGSLLAGDSKAAILHAQSGVWLNGAEAPDSTAILPGDLLETKPGSVANLNAEGASIVIQPESIIKFNGDSLTLEHGSVLVITSTSFSVHVDCLRVVPVTNVWTQYEVSNLSGTVQADAHKNDVNIEQGASLRKRSQANSSTQSATVHEGEQGKRDVSQACGVAAAMPNGAGSGVPQKWIEIGAATGGGILILCLLYCRGKSEPEMSQTQP
jgi:hypothetical protein